jgi:hypothetical protein
MKTFFLLIASALGLAACDPYRASISQVPLNRIEVRVVNSDCSPTSGCVATVAPIENDQSLNELCLPGTHHCSVHVNFGMDTGASGHGELTILTKDGLQATLRDADPRDDDVDFGTEGIIRKL